MEGSVDQEIYKCQDCDALHYVYNNLYHYDEDSGGFCKNCRSELVKLVENEDEELQEC